MPSRRRSSSERMSTISASPAPHASHAALGIHPLDHAPRVHEQIRDGLPRRAGHARHLRRCADPPSSGPRLRSRRRTRRTRMATTTQARSALDPYDFLDVDGLLDDEERAIRDTVRAVRARARPPRRRRLVRAGDPPARAVRRAGAAGPARDAPRGLRPPRRELGRLRHRLPRARGGRRRRAERRLGAGIAGDVRDLALGHGGAEGALAAGDARRRGDRLLRAHGAGCRVRSGLDANARAPRRLGLGAERGEDVDHERDDRGRRGRLGEDGRRLDPRLPRRAGHEGVLGAGDPQEDLAARVRDERARARGRPRARRMRSSPT